LERGILWTQESELTWEQAAAVLDVPVPEGVEKSLPMNNVSWIEVLRFIKKLNDMTGGKFRVPLLTEYGDLVNKEKELAANPKMDNLDWNGLGTGAPSPFKNRDPDENGVFDLVGNLWEYCGDSLSPEEIADMFSPRISHLDVKIITGHSFESGINGGKFTSDSPFFIIEDHAAHNVGFRLCVDHAEQNVRIALEDTTLLGAASMLGRALGREIIVADSIAELKITANFPDKISPDRALTAIIKDMKISYTIDNSGAILFGGINDDNKE